jgi:hypothetical protein
MLLWIHQTIVFLLLFFGSMLAGLLPVYFMFRWRQVRKQIGIWSNTLGNVNAAETKTLTVAPNCQVPLLPPSSGSTKESKN